MSHSFPWKLATVALCSVAVPLALDCPRLPGGEVPRPGLEARSAAPGPLEPPKDQVLLFSLRAEGVQIYEWRAKKDNASDFEWALKAPEATLYDDLGEKVGTHTAGPTWKAKDGSKVSAVKRTGAKAPGGRAVPWLLLRVKSHEGTGVFSKVTYIQRVDTWAGMPPAQGETRENAGNQVRVKYQATYRFFGPAPTK